MTKSEQRKLIKETKRQFSQQQLRELSLCISRKLAAKKQLSEAKTILLYYPLPDEVDIIETIEALHKNGKNVLLPKVVSDTEMTIHEYKGAESLQEGSFGILEPCTPEYGSCEKIEVAVVPGMGFDKQGRRLGRGKGYYDRFLSQYNNIYKVGVCFPFQMLDHIDTDEYDVSMDEVVY